MEKDERSSQLNNRQHASTTIVVREISHIPFVVNMYVLAVRARSVDTTHTHAQILQTTCTLCACCPLLQHRMDDISLHGWPGGHRLRVYNLLLHNWMVVRCPKRRRS
mmetsp:Transcript_19349/g.30859  ORF Transcript_19349/g.30859 Transcript_19349/m.30859 type:complete len:107 (-) Transcript_19349:1757-2077(-)